MPNLRTPSTDETEPLLSVEQAAQYVGLSPKTLDGYRSQGKGPLFTAVGGRIVYRRSDLDAWLGETDGLLDTNAVASLLGLSARHLENMRCYGMGPAFMRLKGHKGPRCIFYRREDVLTWSAQR